MALDDKKGDQGGTSSAQGTPPPTPSSTPTAPKSFKCKWCGEEMDEYWKLGVHSKKCSKRPKREKVKPGTSPGPPLPPSASTPSGVEGVAPPPAETTGEAGIGVGEALFRRPKTPEEVLEDVLKRHSLKSPFVQYAKNRSTDMGGIHPNDLATMLQELDSGIKSKAHVRYIIDDYMLALRKAEAEARRLGHRMSYPMGIAGAVEEETYTPTYGYTPIARGTSEDYYGTGYGERGGPRYLTVDDAERIFGSMLDKRAKEDKLDLLQSQLLSQREEMRKMLEEQHKQIQEEIDNIDTEPPDDVITTKELKAMLESQEVKARLEAQRENLNLQKELQAKTLDELKDTREAWKEDRRVLLEQWKKERDDLLSKIEEKSKPTSPPGEYQSDAYRFGDRVVEGIKDFAKDRRPIQVTIQGLKDLVQPTPSGTQAPPREKVEGKGSLFDLVTPDMIVDEAAKEDAKKEA